MTILLALALVLLSACAPSPAVEHPAVRFVVATQYDMTASAEKLPQLTMAHVDTLVSTVKDRGGVLAFGLIKDRVDTPFDRLALAPVQGRLDQRAERVLANRQATADWKTAVEAKLARRRDVPITDFRGALDQLATFFREPTLPANALKIALLVTDAEHTAKTATHPHTELPADVVVIAVGIPPKVGRKLFGERVLHFENIPPALDMLQELVKRAEKGA